jgi:uncharacterized protein YkwD
VARARIATPLTAAGLLSALALLAAPLTSSASALRAASGANSAAFHARAASACANTSLTPRPGNLELVREAILCLVNRERELHGERPLASSAKLTRAAQGHSDDMAGKDYFSHVAPDGSSPLDRMRASGYIYNSRIGYEVGENIAWGTLWLASPQSIVNSWMASPEHRANILDASYRETGVGVSPHAPASMSDGQAGGLYTQDFGTIFAPGHAAGRAARHRSSGQSGRITSGARTTERSYKSYGSTRRQVRHRHRVRARHRARHRRAARRGRRTGAHQRSRRRHSHAGSRRDRRRHRRFRR